MTLKELQQLYELHNIAVPHEKYKCEICKRWEKRFADPAQDLNGSNY